MNAAPQADAGRDADEKVKFTAHRVSRVVTAAGLQRLAFGAAAVWVLQVAGLALAAGETFEIPGQKEFSRCHRLPRGTAGATLNLPPNTDLEALAAWMSAIGCARLVIPGPLLKGKKVTILAPRQITLPEAYGLFFGALEVHGLTVEPQGQVLRIVENARARSMGLPVITDGEAAGPSDKRYVTRLFRFDHLDPATVVTQLYKQLRGEKGVAIPFAGSVIATDQAVMLERFEEIVRELDRPELAREKLWMERVRSTSARAMVARLAEIFYVRQMAARPGRPAARPQPLRPGQRAGRPLEEMLTIERLIPDDRTNQLIVVAQEPVHDLLRTILGRLDLGTNLADHDLIHVYPCEHAECDELASTLSSITGIPLMSAAGRARPVSGRQRTSVRSSPPAPRSAQTRSSPGPELFARDVRIAFDASTNSLIVSSTRSDFESLRRLLVRLDVPRKQVYVEAMIFEVLLDKRRDLGVAYHGGVPSVIGAKESVILGGFDAGRTLNPAALAGDLVGLAGAVLGPALEASTSRLFGSQVDIPSFGAFIKLLQKNNDVNVLSTPHLLITNNQEGEISVGQRLPFPGGFLGGFGSGLPGQQGAAGGLGGTAVTREDVSLRMKLIPSVNEYNMIRLDVDVEISDLASPNFNGLGPATTKRTAKTPVVCKDQQMVIIGGLMSDRQSDTVSKIPVLGDIPVLGFFFRNTSKQLVKSNIIIALTPYVITDMEDLRRVAEKKMRERREFIERFSGRSGWNAIPQDPGIDYRRTRGMLERIHKAAGEIDKEDAELRRMRQQEQEQEMLPIEVVESPAAPAS